jgi:NADPH:quinone reductase
MYNPNDLKAAQVMKAIVVPRFGGPEVLEQREVPAPLPGKGEMLVKVEAVGLNFADILTAQGGYATTPPPPFVAGREFSGTSETTGEPVMGYTQFGAFAELVSIAPGSWWPRPQAWSAQEAAAFPVNYFTAWLAYWKAGLTGAAPGKDARPPAAQIEQIASRPRVLIHAAAGGVGTAAVQIGKVLGLELYGTSSSREKLDNVRELGLQHGINYKDVDYEQAIREMTQGEGVDAVFEMLGGEHTAKSVRCLRPFGRVIVYGAATGEPSAFDPRLLYARSTSVHGLWLSRLASNHTLMAMAWQQLSQWIAAGQLRPVVGKVLPLARVADAYRLILDRKNYGKIVLQVHAS